MVAVDARPSVITMPADPSIQIKEGITQPEPAVGPDEQASGRIVELHPALDPLTLTQEDLHDTSRDRGSRIQALTILRRRSYNPQYASKLAEIFLEGQPQYTISPEEAQVFDIETLIMADPERELSERDMKALRLLPGVSSDDDIRSVRKEIREEGRLRDDGQVLIGAYEMRGYKMGRQVLREIDRQIEFERGLASRLEELGKQFGSEAYLSPADREFLERYREEEAIRREYEKQHPYQNQPKITTSDLQTIQNWKHIAQDYTD